MFVTRLVIVTTLVLLSACGRNAATPQRSRPPSVSPGVAALRDAGDTAIVERDFERAVATYRQALEVAPADVSLRFRLASALTHLDRNAEAADEFRWITAHGPVAGPEVTMAREWLTAAAPITADNAASRGPSATARQEAAGPFGKVRGRTSWARVPADETAPITLALLLVPDHPTGPEDFVATHTRLGQPYGFDKVPAGAYRLRAEANFVRLWDVRVTVPADGETVVDLTEKNAEVSDREFP